MDLFQSRVSALLGVAVKDFKDGVRKEKIERACELYEWAVNDDYNIIKRLKERLKASGLISQNTYNRFPSWNYINGIPKMLNIICTVYHKAPKRSVIVDGEEDEKATELLGKYLENTNINEAYSDALKFAWLYKIFRVMPVVRDGKIDFDLLLPFQVEIDTEKGNPFKICQIGILNEEWEDGKFERFIIVWKKDKHFMYDADLNEQPITDAEGNSNELKNPYEIIPIATLYLESTDAWGDPQYKLVEHFVSNSLKNIWKDYVAFFHAGGIPVITDSEINGNIEQFGLENTVNETGEIIVKHKSGEYKLTISPDTAIILKSEDPTKPAKFAFVSPDSNLEMLQNVIDWDIKKNLSDYNIPNNAYSMERSATSGYSKMIDEIEIINTRKKHLVNCLNFENEMFEVLKKIIEVEFQEKFPENSKLKVDFAELEFPKSPEEIAKEMDTAIKYNIKSPIDYIQEANPELSREEAEDIFAKNQATNGAGKFNINITPTSAGKGKDRDYKKEKHSAGMGGVGDTQDMNDIEPDKEIEFPDLRQDYDFTCGASALQGILQLYGEDITESELVKELNTEKDWGTEHADIVKVAIAHGFEAESKSMTIEEVQSYIDEDYPVILDIQAWTEQKNVDYSTDKEDGHYVVAIGYDENGFVIEDPSSIGRAYLLFDELETRWHDVDKQGNELKNLGIVVKGEIKYSRNKYVELG